MNHSWKMNRSAKGESFMKRWIVQEKVNHTWKGDSYMKGESYIKRWIIHEKVNHQQKVNHSWKGESFIQKVNQKVIHTWKGKSYIKRWVFSNIWFTFSCMIHLFMNDPPFVKDSPFHAWFTFSWMIHLFMYESPIHFMYDSSFLERWIFHEHFLMWTFSWKGESPFHLLFTFHHDSGMHVKETSKGERCMKRWIIHEKVNRSAKGESFRNMWKSHQKVKRAR